MIKDTTTTAAEPGVPLPGTVLSTAKRQPRKWTSADEKRSFCWTDVSGYDFRNGNDSGIGVSTLYLYLQGSILHLKGTEAESVWEELKKR